MKDKSLSILVLIILVSVIAGIFTYSPLWRSLNFALENETTTVAGSVESGSNAVPVAATSSIQVGEYLAVGDGFMKEVKSVDEIRGSEVVLNTPLSESYEEGDPAYVGSVFKPWSLGLDLSGGSYLVYQIDLSDVEQSERESVVTGLRDVIERRVNLFGVSEPEVYVQTAGQEKRLVVELAGIKDISRAIQEIGDTPFLDFREVEQSTSTQPTTQQLTVGEDGSATATGTIDVNTDSPFTYTKTELTGRYVEGAQMAFSQNQGVSQQPIVNLQFTDQGAQIFERLTSENVGEPIAVFLDNELLTQPTVQQAITGGRAQISGDFTVDEARQLVQRFNAGALPAPITLINQRTVSPSLGHDSLQKSIFAGLIGLAAVLLYMIIYYRKLGVFASIALLMYVSLMLAIFKIIPITLTLSGIAAVILSVGMAVDANILVFERMKEELERDLDFSSAVEEGFRRAWTSIRDANITTIISAGVLFYITTGFVKGFALALIIGVVLSMFSAITITRTMLRVYYQSKEE